MTYVSVPLSSSHRFPTEVGTHDGLCAAFSLSTAVAEPFVSPSTPLKPRADKASGSSVGPPSNGPQASMSSSTADSIVSLSNSAPPRDDAEDNDRRVVFAELSAVELEEDED